MFNKNKYNIDNIFKIQYIISIKNYKYIYINIFIMTTINGIDNNILENDINIKKIEPFIDIYCLHYLLPYNKLLHDEEFKVFFKNLKYKYYFLNNHICIHILDSIHYKLLQNKVSINMYNKYTSITGQKEHNYDIYQKLINKFDIEKMEKIKVYKKKLGENEIKNIISDGCHRLSILLFNNYSNIEKFISYS